MEEKLVSFQVAKLAKEKGFSIPTHSYYFEDGEFKEHEIKDTYGYYGEEYTVYRSEFYDNWNNKWLTKKSGDRCFGCNKSQGYFETFSAPSQSLLQRWLREVHGIHIDIRMIEDEEDYEKMTWSFQVITKNLFGDVEYGDFNSYEEALEVGLQETLKLIEYGRTINII